MLAAQEGTGSTLPSGNYTAKQGYDFEISFSENPAYSFVKWTAVSRADSKTEISEGITFEDEKSPVTNVKITNLSDSIKIVPLCEKRIEVYGEPNPRYEPIGVSRDRSITVNFTKELEIENFFFDETEIPADAEEIKKDEEGKIWAYVYEGQTYLKNVSITNSDDYSIAEHFTCPVVEGKLLSIDVDKTNPIKFNVGENFKTVKVSLSKNITDTLGIKMNAEKSWNYQITESTDEKATVTLTSVAAEGSVYLAGTKDYSLGQKITLSFTEDADYQFVKWDYDSSIIFVAEPESANTIATVLDKTSGEDSTQIKAVCAPRLRVTDYSPVTDGATQTVCKNSSIVISFNHKLPTSEEDLAQLQNISITIGGAPVKSSFKAPVINEDTITFAADNSNMLDVPEGQKKTVSVTVPADFYYTLEDGTKITYGGNGKSFDYKIDDTTLDKAEISFTAASGSGELTAASGTKNYSIGQEVPLVFVPADGYTFNGWSVMCGGQTVDESKIKIADVNALSTKLTVYEALSSVTVRAKTSRCLEISETSPAAQTNPKDSSIIIKFNKELAAECASASMLSKIEISSDVKLDSYYTKRTLSGDTITIENTSPISVPKGTTKVITVTVPSDFYYMNEGNKINLTEKSFSFKVDHTTNAKAKVTYQVINGETGTAFTANAAGVIEGLESAYQEYNIGEDAELSFALNSGYQFYGWSLADPDDPNKKFKTSQVSFKNSTSKDLQPTLTFNDSITLNVNVICYKRPAVISKFPSSSNSSDTFAKNESIEIGFDHKIDAGTENEIVVGYSISSFSKSTYYETSLNSTQDKITLKPIKMLPVEKAYETVTVTVPCAKVYYLAKDGKTKITPADDDYTWSFRVNNSTIDNTIVRMDSTDASGSVIKVNGDDFSTGDKQTVYMEQSINLEYPVPAGYAFSGWKILAESDDYTITPAGYVTSGEITVKKDDVEYCKLIINSEASRKAVFSSTDAIGSGAGGHAITVSVRDVLLPKIETFTPAASVNPKDSEITISFNKELAENCSSLLDKIKITMDGNNVDSFFEDRSLSGNTISIKNTGLLDVTGTAKKTITVTVPSIFYYMDGNSPVYLAEEKSFEYKVDSSTKTKIGIRFDSHENSTKKINVNGAETNNGTKVTYNLGETVNLEYALPGDYKFVGWKIVAVSSDYTVTPSNYVTSGTIALKKDDVTYFTLKIDETNPTKAVVQAFGEVENNSNDYGLSVLTKDVVLPAITETTPSASVVSPKSSTIKIKFNQALAAECSTLLDKIKITMDGNTVDDFFENRSLSSETITIKNTKLLNITGKTTKTINVTVPAIFYYLEGNLKVTLPEEKTFSYKVDANTVEKANIHFDSAASSVKKISVNETEKQHNSDGEFNIGEIVNLEYALPGDYKFAGWKVAAEESYTVTPANYVTSGTITVEKDDKTYFTLTIDEKNSAKAVIQTLEKLEEPDDGYALTVYAKDVELPAITATTPSAATNPKDSVITITFNKAIDAEFSNSDILKKIKITMDGSNVDSFFETRTLSTDRKTISIKNTKLLNVTGNENKNIDVTIPANVFYYKDGDLKVYLQEEKTVSYKVDSSTTNKTTIRFDSSENSIQKLKVNETDVTHGTSKAYNRGETIKLEYSVPATYKFAGWKLTPATNAYTATPSGYVTSGTITVSKNQIPYLTLKIDADNPAKAVVESYEAVENGTDYGVSVFAKDVLLPKVTSVTPAYASGGVDCDTPITITFNKEIDEDTVTFGYDGTIQIVDAADENEHYEEDYFDLDYEWSENTLTIKPYPDIRDLLKDENDIKKLKVKIDYKEIKDTAGNALESDPSWFYRINYEMETTPPVVTNMKLYKPQYNPNEVSGSYVQISAADFDSFTSSDFTANHVKDKIYFDASVYDADSGYKQLTLKETLIKTVDGTPQNIEYPSTTYFVSPFTKKQYNLKSEYDGVVKLEFIFEDYAGATNPQTYYVIRDTVIDATIVLSPAATVFDSNCKDNQFDEKYAVYKKLTEASISSFNKLTANSSNNITETLDFSESKDSFYNNSYAKTNATYEIKYGYSETSITQNATKQSTSKFTFTRDVTKDCYVKISAYDVVGNSDSIIRVFPKRTSIVEMTLVNTGKYYTFKQTNDQDFDALAEQQSALDRKYLFIYKYKPSESAQYSNELTYAPIGQDGTYTSAQNRFHLYNDSYTDDQLSPNGIYQIYVIPYLMYSERNYYGAVSETPYVFYHKVTAPSSSVTPSFGNGNYTINIAEPEAGTGVRKLTATINFTKTSGFTYGICYHLTGNSGEANVKYSDLNCSVKSTFEYYACLYAKDNKTGKIYRDTTHETYIDALDDNRAPLLYKATNNTSLLDSTTPNHIILSNHYPFDYGEGIEVNNDGLNILRFYLLKKNFITDYSNVTKNDLVGINPTIIKYSGDKNVCLDFNKFIESYYDIVFDIRDKSGNAGWYSYSISNYTLPIISYGQGYSTYVRFIYDSVDGFDKVSANSVSEYIFKDGVWQWENDKKVISDTEHKTFLKVRGYCHNLNLSNAVTHTLFTYYSTDFIAKWIDENAKPVDICKYKAMIPGYGNSVLVSCDAPCLVHTMAFHTDMLGEMESKIDQAVKLNGIDRDTAAAAVWATKGQEFGCKLINNEWLTEEKLSTYTAPVSEIPNGFSYVVVVHFADGTTLMTDVKQK